MNIEIQFWGVTARLAGSERRRLSLTESATVADAIELLRSDAALATELPRCAYAVGADLVAPNHSLSEGDELSVLPPVSGG
ncbi:MAG: thiamine S protein [Hydrocarboniphaga sp.]|uniref:MoaD/ThiS family protein n=1 Tax=Hydrocarboniphaga sp. TaxID=2033016 RepID=UPI002602C1B9|nr:MoaD/ThiS family protein [Hydrocarboniphaga sp.]MDB5969771.1 thiamine S protein [Hydrocarboniphaga sp.]